LETQLFYVPSSIHGGSWALPDGYSALLCPGYFAPLLIDKKILVISKSLYDCGSTGSPSIFQRADIQKIFVSLSTFQLSPEVAMV